jgi:hypothetical protein
MSGVANVIKEIIAFYFYQFYTYCKKQSEAIK